MKLQESIISAVQKANSSVPSSKLSALSFYKILNLPYFMGNYKFMDICQKGEKFSLHNESRNNINGLATGTLEGMQIELTNQLFNEHNRYEKTYVSQYTLDLVNQYKEILLYSKNFKELGANIDTAQMENSDLLNAVSIYLCNEDVEYNLHKIVSSVLTCGESNKSDLYKNSVFSGSSLSVDSFVLRDCFDVGYQLNDFIGLSKSEIIKTLLQDTEINNFCRFLCDNDKIKNDQILKLKENDSVDNRKSILRLAMIDKAFFDSTVLGILIDDETLFGLTFSRKSKEEKYLELIDKKLFDDKKMQMLESINEFLDKKPIEKLISENNKDINKVCRLVSKMFNFLELKPTLDNISYKFIVQDVDSDNKESQNTIIDYLENNRNIRIFANRNHDAATKGLVFATDSNLYDTYFNQRYIIATQNEEVVGLLKLTEDVKRGRSDIYNLSSVSVANNFRYNGLCEELIKRAVEYTQVMKGILEISMYTDSGKKHIPNILSGLRIEFPDALILETERCGESASERANKDINDMFINAWAYSDDKDFKESSKIYKDLVSWKDEIYKEKVMDDHFQMSYEKISNKQREIVENINASGRKSKRKIKSGV